MKTGGTEIPTQGILARLKAGIAGARAGFTGNGAEWFGPGQPIAPSAPADVAGRQWQLPISTNTLIQTKVDGVTFGQLRMLADTVDIIRLLIETRKDQLCGMEWSIQLKGATSKEATQDDRCKALEDFFQSPDTDHDWADWLRLVLEDMFVLDAPTLYVQRRRNREVYALRPIDGSTIKRIVDGHGWTPAPPLPAYQQILQGTAAVDYTTDELIYRPRNPRTNRIYGLGHVEQIVVTAQTWLRRQASNLSYYDEGAVPDGLLSMPAEWTAQDIHRYEELFNLQLSGQLGERRKVKMTPPGSKFDQTKEPAFKSDYDEWLARIACYCFSVSPMPFVKMMNRASSEQQQEQADTEGVQPLMTWVKSLIDFAIRRHFGYNDIEFVWADQESPDPLVRAQIDQIYLATKVLVPNEVRADLGLQPLPQPVENDPSAQPTPDPALPAGQAYKADHGHMHKRDESPMTGPMLKLRDSFETAFGMLRDEVAKMPLAKAADGTRGPQQDAEDVAAAFVARIDLSPLSLVYDDLTDTLSAVASDGSKTTIAQIVAEQPGVTVAAPEGTETSAWSLFGGQDPRAVEWATEHAGELLTKDGTGGQLAEATRNMIRRTIVRAMEQDLTRKQIAFELTRAYAFSPERAELIARTEVRMAQGHGHLIGAKAAGQTEKRWLLSNTDTPCPLCQANADQGFIPIGKNFVSGVQAPLMHPNCRCAITFRRGASEK